MECHKFQQKYSRSGTWCGLFKKCMLIVPVQEHIMSNHPTVTSTDHDLIAALGVPQIPMPETLGYDASAELDKVQKALNLATGQDVLAELDKRKSNTLGKGIDLLAEIDNIQRAIDLSSGKALLADMEVHQKAMTAALQLGPLAELKKHQSLLTLASPPEELAQLQKRHKAIMASLEPGCLTELKKQHAVLELVMKPFRDQQEAHQKAMQPFLDQQAVLRKEVQPFLDQLETQRSAIQPIVDQQIAQQIAVKAAMAFDPSLEMEKRQLAMNPAMSRIAPQPANFPRIVSKPPVARHTDTLAVSTVSDLGRIVQQKRKAMKVTQQQFADLAGVGRRFILELEAGKPTLEFGRVLKVCKAAGIDLTATSR
jgi:y4mF family transcriptional regulator